ncbi:lys-63-specific deubiquitinase BRCC36-like isoform 1 [Mucor ambiguus]|uniref:Lys-63-specific deubiquitinase BRCC36-like isoform 1 n=1 Tax=Mucor ambiguus TaxID=91626 RepID=A0A0C9MNJ0_9FUNG|nr:lys-63-specific deubiquitinase BRCC36-like isoform 1 [Mucor ambiguus]
MLNQVVLPAYIYHLILTHAYSTENEEIIGMLIGCWETVSSNNPYQKKKSVAHVKYISFLTRSDKRKDRVEIAPESLHLAALEAEASCCIDVGSLLNDIDCASLQEFGKKIGKPMMVIGWYHSHPHITVFPSHVGKLFEQVLDNGQHLIDFDSLDLRTQLSQQLMDDKFFGIIVSCFDSHNDNTEKLQITCFQSAQDNQRLNIPLLIEPTLDMDSDIRELLLKLPEHMYEEYKKEFSASNECIKYDLRFINNIDTSSIPNTMTQLYNAGVYGQLLTSLVDNMIIPTTHILDLKAMELAKEIEELQKFKQALSLSTNNEEALKFKTKAQLLYGASKIMRQQSYFLYDDSTKLWSKLKSDMLNPTVSSFIDMDKTISTQVPHLVLLRYLMRIPCCSFKHPKGLLYSHLWYFDFSFNHQINHHPDMDDSSVILRIETSRNTGLDSLEMLESSAFQYSLNDSLLQRQQQQQEEEQGGLQQQEYIYDDIDIRDIGYDMMDYEFDEQNPQQDISAIINKLSTAEQPEAQDDSVFDFPLAAADMQLQQHPQYASPLNQAAPLIVPAHIAAASYHGLGPIRNASGPPSLIQEDEEEEEQDNMSTSSVSTTHLSTLLPIEAINDGQAAQSRARRMKRMVMENTTLSYATDYTTDAIVVRTSTQFDVANARGKTGNQKLARTRLNLRYPSIVFNATYHKDILSTEQGIEQSRRYDHFRVLNTSGSTLSQFNVPGIRRLSHQAPSSGGVSVRSHSDVHNTPEMHNLDLDGDMELERVQEENTSIWQQQHQFQPVDDDVMDYGGDSIDFDTDMNVGFSGDLLQQQQQQRTQDEEMQEFMEHIRQLPNPFFFNEHLQFADLSSWRAAKSFAYILELASRSQILVSQTEPYAPIEVHYLF